MYRHILVPLDGSELAECVLPHVETIAKGRKACKVTLIRVVPPLHLYGGVESSLSPEERQRLEVDGIKVAQDYLAGVIKGLKDAGIKAESAVLYGGQVVDEIVEYTENSEVDLVVIATHGRSGVSRWVLGSVADRILRAVCTPVLMVRAPGCMPGI
jgi:nucleotide-binding universal stress UspA family protein